MSQRRVGVVLSYRGEQKIVVLQLSAAVVKKEESLERDQ